MTTIQLPDDWRGQILDAISNDVVIGLLLSWRVPETREDRTAASFNLGWERAREEPDFYEVGVRNIASGFMPSDNGRDLHWGEIPAAEFVATHPGHEVVRRGVWREPWPDSSPTPRVTDTDRHGMSVNSGLCDTTQAEEKRCTCEYIDIGIGLQRSNPDPDCPEHDELFNTVERYRNTGDVIKCSECGQQTRSTVKGDTADLCGATTVAVEASGLQVMANTYRCARESHGDTDHDWQFSGRADRWPRKQQEVPS